MNIRNHILQKHLKGKLAFYEELDKEHRENILEAIYEAMEEYGNHRAKEMKDLNEVFHGGTSK